MAVDLQDVAEGIFHIDHAKRLLTRKILAYRHALLAAGGDDPGGEAFHVGVLDAEVKYAGLPVFEVVAGLLGVAEFEDFHPDAVAGRQVSDAERPQPAPNTSVL